MNSLEVNFKDLEKLIASLQSYSRLSSSVADVNVKFNSILSFDPKSDRYNEKDQYSFTFELGKISISSRINLFDVSISVPELIENEVEVEYFYLTKNNNDFLLFLTNGKQKFLLVCNKKGSITNNLAFPLQYSFYSTDDYKIITDFQTNLYLIIDNHELSCNCKIPFPSLNEIKIVLHKKLIHSIYKLFQFWCDIYRDLKKILKTNKPINTSVKCYLQILTFHVTLSFGFVMDFIYNNNDNPKQSNFIELLVNVANDLTMKMMRKLLRIQESMIKMNLDRELTSISENILVLSIACEEFRDISIKKRFPERLMNILSVKKHILSKISFDKTDDNKTNDDAIKMTTKQRNDMIRQHLINGHIAELKKKMLIWKKEQITDAEILEQQKKIVYSKIYAVEWAELKNIIKKLGLNPQSCLTLMCMETNEKEMRTFIYDNLEKDTNAELMLPSDLTIVDNDLTMQQKNMRLIKTNIMDPFDKCFLFPVSIGKCYSLDDDEYINELSIPTYTENIVKRYGSSEKEKIAKLLSSSSSNSHSKSSSKLMSDMKPLVNFKMIWFIDLIQRSNDIDWKKMLDLCLIDGKYQKMFPQIDLEHEDDEKVETLCTFIRDWQSKPTILLQYLLQSTNEQVIFKVYQILTNQKINKLESPNEMIELINESFLEILSMNACSKIDKTLTEIDKYNVRSAIWLCLLHNDGIEIDIGFDLLNLLTDRHVSGKEPLIPQSDKLLPINVLHYTCSNEECAFLKGQKPLKGISDGILEDMIIRELQKKRNEDSETSYKPNFVLFSLLQDSRGLTSIQLDKYPDLDYSTRKVVLYHSSLSDNGRTQVNKFLAYLSQHTCDLPDNLADNQLDELLYAVLLSGMSYADMLQSKDELFMKVNNLLSANQYKERLRLRLIRRSSSLPLNQNEEKLNDELAFEEYYSVDLLDFLEKSGSAVSRKFLFGDDKPTNPENHQCVTLADIQQEHRDLYENKLPQLDYVYYLSLCRPYQAFVSILKEFSSPNRPQHLHVDIMKDLVRNIHIIALTNCLDSQIVGSCFAVLRLLKWTVEPLKCYFNLLEWLVDWSYVQYTKQNQYVTLEQSDEREKEVKAQYQVFYADALIQCHSKDILEKKEAWEFIISELEHVFLDKIESEYDGLSDLLCIWGRILYFCQLMNMPPSIKLLEHYAQSNNWLMYLVVAQVFGYSEDRVKETINYFKDSSIRHHIGYVVSKVTEVSLDSSVKMRGKKKIPIKSANISSNRVSNQKSTDDTMMNTNYNTATNSQNSQSEQAPIGNVLPNQAANQRRSFRKLSNQKNAKPTTAVNNKSYLPNSSSSSNNNISFGNIKVTKASLINRAKSNLLELLFDCQYRENSRNSGILDSHIFPSQSQSKSQILLSSDRLLSYCIALSHPFLAVLACYGVNDKGIPITEVETEANYINCLACFIIASLPDKARCGILAQLSATLQNSTKSVNHQIKINWKENELIRLILLCVEHHEITTIYDAISVMRPLGFVNCSNSALMMSQTMPLNNQQQGMNVKFQTILIGFWKLMTHASSGNTIQRILSLRQLVFNTVDLVHLSNHSNQRQYHSNKHHNMSHLHQHNYPPLLLLWRRLLMYNNCQVLSLTLASLSSNKTEQNYRLIDDWLNELWTDPISQGLSNSVFKHKVYDFSEFGVLWRSIRLYSNMRESVNPEKNEVKIAAEKFETLSVPVNIRNSNFIDFVSSILEMVPLIYDNKANDQALINLLKDGIRLIEAVLDIGLPLAPIPKWESVAEDFRAMISRATMNDIKPDINNPQYSSLADVLCMGLSGQSDMEDIVYSCLPYDPLNLDLSQQSQQLLTNTQAADSSSSISSSLTVELSSASTLTNSEPQMIQKKHSVSNSFKLKKDYGSTSDSWRRMVWPEEWQNDIMNLTPASVTTGPSSSDSHKVENISHVKSLLYANKWIEACSYMIEHNVYVVDALLILVGMKIACGRMDPLKLPSSIRETVNIGLRRSSTQLSCTQSALHGSGSVLRRADKDPTYSSSNLDNCKTTLNFSGLGARRRSSAAFFLKAEENTSRRRNVSSNLINSTKRIGGVHTGSSNETTHSFLVKLLSVLNFGQEIMESVLTLYCVAKNMQESYTQVIENKEFDVLTKILTGSCKEKMETARMYLQIVNVNVQKMSNFLANITIWVLESELLPGNISQRRTYPIGLSPASNSVNQLHASSVSFTLNSPGHSPMVKSKQSSGASVNKRLSVGKISSASSASPIQNLQQQQQQAHNFHYSADDTGNISVSELQKIVSRCSLRPDWNTGVVPHPNNDMQTSTSPNRYQNSVSITPMGTSSNFSSSSSSIPTPTKGTIKTGEARLMKAFYLQELLRLAPSFLDLGNLLYKHFLRMSQTLNNTDEADFLVNLLILSHTCFTECGDTIGISHCLKSAKDIYRFLAQNNLYLLMAYLLCRIGRYGEMPYIIKTLIDTDHFELLLRKDMDREGKIVPYLLDYLKRYLNHDYEKVVMVCSKYHCFYELATTQSKRAEAKEIKLKQDFIRNASKDELRSTISLIVSDLLNSCKYYFKVGCYRKTVSNFRKAQFFLLQDRWIEDPLKTFSSGVLSRNLKTVTSKVTLPDTGYPYGVLLINMNKEQATYFMKKVPDFYTAYLVINYFKFPDSIWKDLIVLHAILNGDHQYLENYFFYITSAIPASFIQQCMNILQRLSIRPLNKQGLENIRKLLRHSDDKSICKEIEEKYKLK